MARLLVVHHTPSPSVHAMLESVLDGARTPEIEGVEVEVRAALGTTVPDVLAADGYLLGTTANFGYMSGALKHFFDTVYYPCLTETRRRPYGMFVHGNNDTDGAVSSIEKIVAGLEWDLAQRPVTVADRPSREDLDACWELGAAVAAGLTG
ncbi:MAG: flavodoxin family protein [Actinomycetota bacterium]|nr:flavodoxin family protein [Actinomycetota bacterium]